MQRQYKCSPVVSFANCIMTLYLLKVYLQTFLPIPITQKCQILSCDTLVANERYDQHDDKSEVRNRCVYNTIFSDSQIETEQANFLLIQKYLSLVHIIFMVIAIKHQRRLRWQNTFLKKNTQKIEKIFNLTFFAGIPEN
jgi:hypothetical protein